MKTIFTPIFQFLTFFSCCNNHFIRSVKAAKCKPCSSISSSELYEIKNYEVSFLKFHFFYFPRLEGFWFVCEDFFVKFKIFFRFLKRDKSVSSRESNSIRLRFEDPIYEEEPMCQPCDHRGNTEIQSKQEKSSSKECKPCAPSTYSFKHRKPCPPEVPDYCLCMPLPRSCNCPPPIQVFHFLKKIKMNKVVDTFCTNWNFILLLTVQ